MPDHETAAAICLDIIHFLRVNFPYKNALLKAVYEDDVDPVSIIQVIKRNCNQIQSRNHFHYFYESQELLNLIDGVLFFDVLLLVTIDLTLSTRNIYLMYRLNGDNDTISVKIGGFFQGMGAGATHGIETPTALNGFITLLTSPAVTLFIDQVKSILNQALEHEGPALVDVAVNRQELAMPPTITLEQIKGFTLYMIKAVLNGKGDEVVDLAKTNLFT